MILYRFPYLHLLLVVCIGLAASTKSEIAYVEKEFRGKVIAALQQRLVIEHEQRMRIFVVNDRTTIELDGVKAVLMDLTPKLMTEVVAVQDGDRWVAKSIKAKTKTKYKTKYKTKETIIATPLIQTSITAIATHLALSVRLWLVD